MASGDLRAYVAANLPEPPARVLEVGAGDGRLGRALRAVGYDVLAIDPGSESEDVRPVALVDLDEPGGSFAAAIAIVSLHHVNPLEDSCRRLGELVADQVHIVHQAVRPEEHRRHLHPLDQIVAALEPHFELGPPLRGPWLHRWKLGESLRAIEDEAIASRELPATGARLIGRRRPG